MADVKWIKIVTDIFDNRKIKQIDNMPEADAVLVIWFKLLCLAGQINEYGTIIMTKDLPYTDEMLATEFKKPINIIRLALTIFEKFDMISIQDNVFCISNWDKYQNVETLDKLREQTRVRVERHREKQKTLAGVSICQYCGAKATGQDHILAISRGGADIEENKVPCCIECNRIKNDKPLVDFLNSNRDRVNDDIVLKNAKIASIISLCNVTDRYTVTLRNAIERDIERDIDKDLDKDIRSNARKPKKDKPVKKQYAEFVHMTEDEHAKLVEQHGVERVERIITILDNYKGANGKKYASDYRAILNWVIDKEAQSATGSDRAIRVQNQGPSNVPYNRRDD